MEESGYPTVSSETGLNWEGPTGDEVSVILIPYRSGVCWYVLGKSLLVSLTVKLETPWTRISCISWSAGDSLSGLVSSSSSDRSVIRLRTMPTSELFLWAEGVEVRLSRFVTFLFATGVVQLKEGIQSRLGFSISIR